jgi:hypothetical protein
LPKGEEQGSKGTERRQVCLETSIQGGLILCL